MLRSKVGYSINPDSFMVGVESAKESTKDFSNVKLNFLFTSVKNDIKKLLKEYKVQIMPQLLDVQVVEE